MNTTSIVGIIAGILTSCSLLPQLIKIIKDKRVEDLSLGMFITLVTGIGLWIVYGILRDDMPIMVTNGFAFTLNIAILFFHFKYKRKPAVSK
ncbi:SemiSWEET transporter [Aridibaculum aurantiacum]|uniref:SemiSWEET transporter n=1 Tax=Aridibaculum aurantiacum TaxID=2810307 RepID=UPI001A95EDE7|nr:SemiSWEET transporter [Aridibaculum aurantiacum]